MDCKPYSAFRYTSLFLVFCSASVHFYQFKLLSWHFSRVEFDEDDHIAVLAIHLAIRVFKAWALVSSLLGFLAVYGSFCRRPELVRIYITEQFLSHFLAFLTFIPLSVSTYSLSRTICSVFTRGEWLSRSFYEFGSPEVCEERWQAIFVAAVVISTLLWLFTMASTFILWTFYRDDRVREKKLIKSLYGPIVLNENNTAQKKPRRKYSVNSVSSRPRSKSLLPTDKSNISMSCPASSSPTSTSFPPLPHSPHRSHSNRHSKQSRHKRSFSTCASNHTSFDKGSEKRLKEDEPPSSPEGPHSSQELDSISSGATQITSWATKRRSTFPAVRESQSFQVHFLKDGSFTLGSCNSNIELSKLDEKKGQIN